MKKPAVIFALATAFRAEASDPSQAHWAETIPADEAQATAEVSAMLASKLRMDTEPGTVMKRDAHAKHHGCVDATMTIDSELAPDLTAGMFQPGESYRAMIRLSNGSGKSDDDRTGDGRGFAMKVYGVPGDKILADPEFAEDQDFLMINHPVFFVRNAADYVDFTRAVTSGNPVKFFFPGINPANWRITELRNARAVQKKTLINPLAGTYFSMTPSALGSGKVVKYRVSPCYVGLGSGQKADSRDYLRKNMTQTLSTQGACFEFAVQTQVDAVRQPVEDPTVIWDEKLSPFRRVALIQIASQKFDTAERNEMCESTSLNPWHSLPEHRPLGGINRVRKTVYETIRNMRKQHNAGN